MNKLIYGFVGRSLMGVLLSLLSFSAWAGSSIGTITYGPVVASTPVPTMSGVMLVLLALLLATIAYRILRQKENHAGRMMVLSLLAVGTLASGIGGIKLIDEAYAEAVVELTDPTGSQINIPFPGVTGYINHTGVVTEIKSVTVVQDCFVGDPPPPEKECSVGTQLSIDEVCLVYVFCDR